jgi:hypothetical protein
MSFEDLDNLPALKIPEVHLVVLAAGNNPFSTCNAEAGDDAILCVSVSHVGLEATRGVVVP